MQRSARQLSPTRSSPMPAATSRQANSSITLAQRGFAPRRAAQPARDPVERLGLSAALGLGVVHVDRDDMLTVDDDGGPAVGSTNVLDRHRSSRFNALPNRSNNSSISRGVDDPAAGRTR